LPDDFDVAGTIGTLVTVDPGLTDSQLSRWFDDAGTAQHPDILGGGSSRTAVRSAPELSPRRIVSAEGDG
jgi:hypothetical protein